MTRRSSSSRSYISRTPFSDTNSCLSLASNLLEKSLAGDGAAEEALDEVAGGFFAPAAEDQVAEASAGRCVHEIGTECPDQIECDDLRPHVAVVAGGVSARDVLKRAGKRCPFDVAHRCRGF